MKDAVATMGTILTDEEGRDAVHIAVIAVVAQQRLYPGQNIDKNGSTDGELIGIVDPFLKERISIGQKFWLFLYPRTITSLRHVWEHPAFPKEEVAPAKIVDIEASKRWLRKFIDTNDCPGYDTLINAAVGDHDKNREDDYTSSSNDGEYLHFNGLDAHGEIPDEFWDHVEAVTGRKCPLRPKYFSCSC